jgi:hypothetical protein
MSVLSGFTRQEKEACLPIVDLMLECAETARKEGVLALEQWVTDKDPFLKFVILLIVDGTDPELVQDIGETLIDSGGHTGSELLSRMMMMEGCLSVQAGDNPRIIVSKLLAMLGEQFLAARGHMKMNDFLNDPVYQQQSATVGAQMGIPGSEEFCAVFDAMSNRDIQNILREVDIRELTVALKGMNGKTADHFLSNCSKRLGAMILETMEAYGPIPTEDVLAAQGRMMDILTRLQKAGNIVIKQG